MPIEWPKQFVHFNYDASHIWRHLPYDERMRVIGVNARNLLRMLNNQ